MDNNIFNDLANRFSEYEENPEVPIEAIAGEAGKAFYQAFTSDRFDLDYDDVVYIYNLDRDPLENLEIKTEDFHCRYCSIPETIVLNSIAKENIPGLLGYEIR